MPARARPRGRDLRGVRTALGARALAPPAAARGVGGVRAARPRPAAGHLRAGVHAVTTRGARARPSGRDAGLRAVDRAGPARFALGVLHRAVDVDEGAFRDRDGRVAGSDQAFPVVRHARSLHHGEDGGRVRRIAVTGLGVVSPFGVGTKAYWNGLSAGVCAIRPVTLIETEGFRCRIAAEVPNGIGGSLRRSRADGFALPAAG